MHAFFENANQNHRWLLQDVEEQERSYGGYKKSHCFSVIVSCDLSGRIIRIDMTNKGANSDRNMYMGLDMYKKREQFLSPGQHGMADMGPAGDGEVIVQFWQNDSTSWMYRTVYNLDIRR